MSEHDLTQVCNILARVLLLQVYHPLGHIRHQLQQEGHRDPLPGE